ncbi:MAG: hypothetical protein J6Y78_15270 [Paludibacteraceae bacterium]|nr:hypothetical protein [Paludibacteraceae bacterium]
MSRAFQCDRCGGYFSPVSKVHDFLIEDISDGSPKRMDICPLCHQQFETWWKAGKSEEIENGIVSN